MYEKLDKLRAELERAKKKRADMDAKVKQMEQRLKDAENNQILEDVAAMKLSPEQLAQFLQLVSNGQLPMPGAVTTSVSTVPVVDEKDTEEDEESEDFDDEEI